MSLPQFPEINLDKETLNTVKLIDVFPDSFHYDTPHPSGDAGKGLYPMGGYQMLVRAEIFRGRYRKSYENPSAFAPGKIEEIKLKNEPTFSYSLFDVYPDKIEEEKVDLSKLGNAGFRMYDASRVRENLAPARTVVDLHIEKLTDSWKHLSNFEILTIQLKALEKFYDLAVSHYQPSLIIIHGVGSGKLKDEIHEILKTKKEVKSFVNQYHPSYGYGATEIFFGY